jgi:hypothetical protein
MFYPRALFFYGATTMRTKTYEKDDFKIAYSALTMEQVNSYLDPVDTALSTEQRLAAYQDKQFTLVAVSLNNIEKKKPEPQLWDKNRIQAEFDMVVFNELQIAILEISGLKLIEQNANELLTELGIRPGETPAAQV